MKPVKWFTLMTFILLQRTAFADDMTESTRVKVGEKAPDFTCRTLSGKDFTLSGEKGKVVLVTFFATWCGACLEELPHLEKEIFKKYANGEDFRLIVIGREHTAEELATFRKEKGFSLPFAADPKREIYDRYAEKYIPRNFVVGKDGTIKLTTVGYTEEDFKNLVETIRKELGN